MFGYFDLDYNLSTDDVDRLIRMDLNGSEWNWIEFIPQKGQNWNSRALNNWYDGMMNLYLLTAEEKKNCTECIVWQFGESVHELQKYCNSSHWDIDGSFECNDDCIQLMNYVFSGSFQTSKCQ